MVVMRWGALGWGSRWCGFVYFIVPIKSWVQTAKGPLVTSAISITISCNLGDSIEEEYLHRKKLGEAIYASFQSSRWYPLSYKKKIPKDLIPHLFQDVLEKLEGTEFTFAEKFVGICDFISVPYLKAYEQIPVKYREIIINELETEYSILSRRKIKRLF